AGVVVGSLLGIFGTPVLVVEQHVGDAAVGLVHSDDVGARGIGARLRDGGLRALGQLGLAGLVGGGLLGRSIFLLLLLRLLLVLRRDGERGAGPMDLTALELQDTQELRLGARPRIVGREDVRGRPFGLRLLDRPAGLQREVAQKLLTV